MSIVFFELEAAAWRKSDVDGEGMEVEYLVEKGVLVEVVTVHVHPRLPLPRAQDLTQPGGGETLLDPSVGPPIDAGGPVLGCRRRGGGRRRLGEGAPPPPQHDAPARRRPRRPAHPPQAPPHHAPRPGPAP